MRSVLLVEDDAGVRNSLRYLLENWGFEVAVAADGLGGLEQAGQRHDVVLLDLGLPLLDGCEVARRIRALHGDGVLLVGITGSRLPVDKVRLLAAGVDFHLVKPVDPHALRELLNAA
jgi:DNA-binding response OmpR family regulator